MDDMEDFGFSDVGASAEVPEMLEMAEEVPELPAAEEVVAEAAESSEVPDDAPESPDLLGDAQEDGDLATVRGNPNGPETLASPEVDGTTIDLTPEGDSLELPEGWRPGGPEGGF